MIESAYMTAVEAAFDQPDELERLAASAAADSELSELDKLRVQGRIGSYQADEARSHADPELGELPGISD